jgi:hypothetical protein
MAHFLRGNFKGFYAAGSSACVRDVFRFRQLGEGKVLMEVTRRDMESVAGRYWRYENARMSLTPIDAEQPRLGGTVQVKSFVADWRTLTFGLKTQYGVYSDDFITYGTFAKEAGSVLDDEATLLSLVEGQSLEDSSSILDKTTFRFDNNALSFSKEVNADHCDAEVEHAIPESSLVPQHTNSWTEALFYGIGNKSV